MKTLLVALMFAMALGQGALAKPTSAEISREVIVTWRAR